MGMVRGRWIFAAFVGTTMLAGVGPGLAATQTAVDCGAGGDLQAAINGAKAGTIISISGTCRGTFTVGKNLVLKGVSAAVLDAQGAGTTLTVVGGKVRVTKLVVTGGRALAVTPGAEGEEGPGGILNLGAGTLTLVHVSTISSNVGGTGVTNGVAASATLTITDSTVTGNESYPDAGGIENDGGSVTLTRSTIAYNSSRNSSGGGIGNYGGTFRVIDSTISGNATDESGGGIINYGTATFSGTILAGNTQSDDDRQDNCAGAGTFMSNGYNIFGTPCGAAAPTDLVGTFAQPIDAVLKALGNYGGPTQTMVPRPSSPAVNKIPVGASGGVCPDSGTTDQRGIARPQSGACDIGSVERKPKD
ncbi:MAG TPA: choice-of-anchor Q domain-containing protein [Jatrophihabitantaceae bacterium]